MIDYRGLQALYTVIQQQGFDKAALVLHITQSAISQRIKSLENYYGEPLLIRSLPYKPTKLGEKLLGHFKRIMTLEETLSATLQDEQQAMSVSIAVNSDSLETWFPKVLEKTKSIIPITMEIICDDQEVTLEYLQKGLVGAAVSTHSKALTGCSVDFLGYADYVLVSTPSFYEQYFASHKSNKKKLLAAPAIMFDHKDTLHYRYLKRFFDVDEQPQVCHFVPSVHGFRQLALLGHGCALIPRFDISKELLDGRLVEVYPKKVWDMPLYWHHFAIETKAYQAFNRIVINTARKLLRTR